MPKRSNDFQKIILHLQSLTAPGYEVKESKFLKDSITGQMREVDIVIESSIAGYNSIVSIEVIGWQKKKGDIEWVERMACKHNTLPTSTLVLVSKSGFTKNALKKAEFLNITTLTIEEALEKDWSEFINSLGRYEEISNNYSCRIDTKKYPSDTGPPEIDGSKIYAQKDVREGVDLKVFIDWILQNKHLKDSFFSTIGKDSSRNYTVVYESASPIYVLETNGKFREIAKINIDLKSRQKTFNFNMSSGSFRNKDIAFGTNIASDKSAIITLMKDNENHRKITGYIEDEDGTRVISGECCNNKTEEKNK
ncbi:MAG: hypothetical protein J7K53_07265 [Bacteroidales bacterium]|nr:hypothetical protein [Bacteroidales bacterium]